MEGGDFAVLREQIEAIHNATGLPVVAVALSMGANYFQLFLTSGFVSEEWKARHVRAFVSASGGFSPPRLLVSGSQPPQWARSLLHPVHIDPIGRVANRATSHNRTQGVLCPSTGQWGPSFWPSGPWSPAQSVGSVPQGLTAQLVGSVPLGSTAQLVGSVSLESTAQLVGSVSLESTAQSVGSVPKGSTAQLVG